MGIVIRVVSFVLAILSGISFGYGLSDLTTSRSPDRATDIQDISLDSSDLAGITSNPAWATPIEVSVLPPWPGPSTSASAWITREDVSASTGLRDVFLTAPSGAPPSCQPNRPASLILRCMDDRTSVLIGHDCNTPSQSGAAWPVEVWVDDVPGPARRWLPDDLGQTFGLWTYRDARDFIETLLMADHLRMRFADATGTVSDISFPLAGLADALIPLREACGWSDIAPWSEAPPAANSTGTRLSSEGMAAEEASHSDATATVSDGSVGTDAHQPLEGLTAIDPLASTGSPITPGTSAPPS